MHRGAAQAETSAAWWFGSVKIIYIPSGASGTVRACLALLVFGQASVADEGANGGGCLRIPNTGFGGVKLDVRAGKQVVLNAL